MKENLLEKWGNPKNFTNDKLKKLANNPVVKASHVLNNGISSDKMINHDTGLGRIAGYWKKILEECLKRNITINYSKG
jgi:hypothetical protein